MPRFLSKIFFILLIVILTGCASVASLGEPHSVLTIDRVQAEKQNCVYLYGTSKQESGWGTSMATANALNVLKNQARIASGNAVVITDIYSSERGYGYYSSGLVNDYYATDTVSVSVDVYKCAKK